MLTNRLTEVLDSRAIGYEIIHHEADYSAMRAAADTHTPGGEFAKAVVLETRRGPALAVLPAPKMVDFEKFAAAAGTDVVCLADEQTVASLFPDCEVGAEPPFGHLYGVPVYLDESLATEEYITFNAGSHDEAIRLRFRDYEEIEHPTHAAFATAP